ncbi:endothelin-converting enzyme 1-like isoform X2 [Actinia tenebrosa]|uniref:Endothelin-converting enzyme 1-like isoform X2 n=1 Tax=Actinia tenebrosa TaxID=6105 RepID=A0A6P8ICN0_ACTTE|nr:endothelin-converting enzyme 1-like isoform X2 [Actinia tenebrosa]
MGRMMNSGSGLRQENKRWSLIHGPRFLAVLLVISMIHVAASQNEMDILDQGLNKIRSPRHTNTRSSIVCSTTECVNAANEIKRSMNLTADPCNDFYEYACGRWPTNNPFPPGYSYYGQFDKAELVSEQYKKRKLETASITVNGATREVRQMPSNLYKSCMNVTAIDNLGDAPLRERIRELGGWELSGNWDENTWDFKDTLLLMHKMKPRTGPLFLLKVYTSGNNANIFISQDGTVLKAKSQYQNLASKDMIAYKQLIIDVLLELGVNANTAGTKADEIVRFEFQLAGVSLTLVQWIQSFSNTVTLAQLKQQVPQVDWSHYLNGLFGSTIPDSEVIRLPTLSYLKKAMSIVKTTPKRILANYMVWYVIHSELKWLSAPFRNALRKYRLATGDTASEPARWQTCVKSAFYNFDDIISAAYVHDHHAQLARPINKTKDLFNEAIQAFKDNINSLTWLDSATRSNILREANALVANVGFPDYMLDSRRMATIFQKYSGLVIRSGTYFKNQVAVLKHEQQIILNSLRTSPDSTLWFMSPLHGMAVYKDNRLTIPAAIIKSPHLFSSALLRSYNLGHLGSIIAYQIVWGIGDIGGGSSKVPQKTVNGFNTRQKCLADQYSAYSMFGRWPINGKDTVKGNAADNGALKMALKAYYNRRETTRLQGLNLSNEQLLYVGFAQAQCSSTNADFRSRNPGAGTDFVDSKTRVIGSLANSGEFSNAFNCRRGSPLNPIKKCYLWSKDGLLV